MKLFTKFLTFVLLFATNSIAMAVLSGRRISTNDGLLSNQVNDMAQDEFGFIWMGTSSGLCRFDGHSFVNYPLIGFENKQIIGNIGTFYIDHKNSLLWIETASFNHACYDLKKQCFVDYTGTHTHQDAYQKSISENGYFWMYELERGIRRITYRNGIFECKDYPLGNGILPKCKIRKLITEERGNAWILTNQGVLHIDSLGDVKTLLEKGDFLIGQRWKEYIFLLNSDNKISILTPDGRITDEIDISSILNLTERTINSHFIWQDKWLIITHSSVVVFDLKKHTVEKPSDLQMDYGLVLNEVNGNYWLSDKNGGLHLLTKTGKKRTFNLLRDKGYTLTHRRRFSVTEGTDGKFYIATYGNGLFVYDPSTEDMKHYTANDPSPMFATNYLTNIMKDNNGGIWIGQEKAGCVYLYEENRLPIQYIYAYPDIQEGLGNYISHLKQTTENNIVFTTRDKKKFQFNPVNNKIRFIGNETFDNNKIDSIQDRLGRTWIATWEQGLLLKEKNCNGKIVQKQYLAGISNKNRINVILMDAQGEVWIGTYNGLYKINANISEISEDMFIYYGKQNKYLSDNILCLINGKNGTLWIGTRQFGVLKCFFNESEEMTIETVLTTQQFANHTYSLTEDKEGYIWAGMEEYILRINPKNMKAERFQIHAPLLSRMLSENCATCLTDGRLAFGTHNGIAIITPPKEETTNHSRNKAYVTNIKVNGILYNTSLKSLQEKGLTLSHKENSFTIYFSSMDYNRLQQTIYQYYLEGIDSDWCSNTQQCYADYNRLPPGKYKFHLRTNENEQETIVDIRILQPWYNTWQAWLCFLIVITVFCYYFYCNWNEKFKLKQQNILEKQMSEFRIDFFIQVAHEFRTPLSVISGAVDKMTDNGPVTKRTLSTAKRGVQRLLQLVSLLMEFRKITTDNLRLAVEQGDLVGFIHNIYQDFWLSAQQKELSMTFIPFDKKCELVFDTHIIDVIVYNLLSNAIKYTPQKGNVEVRLKKEEHEILFIVEDSGPGISPEREKQLFKPFMQGYASQGGIGIGLYTASKMAAIHKGKLTYASSEKLGGSKFTLSIPFDSTCYTVSDYKSLTAINKSEEKRVWAEQIIQEMQPQALNDCRVVIIADDADMLQQLKTELGSYFHVDGYTHGETAYEGILSKKPSLVICDIMLPDINGYEIVRRIKSEIRLKNIPIIMLTALDDESHQIKGYAAGADDYLVKPCNYHILIARTIQLIKWSSINENQEQDINPDTPVSSIDHVTILSNHADKRLLERIETIIMQHLDNPDFTIDQMAEILKMGRTKLYGKIKELTGKSPNKFLMSKRMQVAAKLLEEGELNVSEISNKVGFQDASYFNKCFKLYFGTVPSKYKKTL